MGGSALNLFQLAHLLSEGGISMVLCHGKRDAYAGLRLIDNAPRVC